MADEKYYHYTIIHWETMLWILPMKSTYYNYNSLRNDALFFTTFNIFFFFLLRLGAQSVTLLSTLRDPTQLRRHQCATRQHPFFVAHQKEGIGQPKKVQHHIGGGQQQKKRAKSSKL